MEQLVAQILLSTTIIVCIDSAVTSKSAARVIASGLGFVAVCAGILILLFGLFTPIAGALVFWAGVLGILIGKVISRLSPSETCPECAARVSSKQASASTADKNLVSLRAS